MEKTTNWSLCGNERNYRIKKSSLASLETSKVSHFEKHMIQEGVKQVLFAGGTEEIESFTDKGESKFQRIVPKETIRFLLDYDIIEEYKF